MPWPRSLPDYQWPRDLLSWRRLPGRVVNAAAFHAGYVAGRIAGILAPSRPAVLAIRTDGIGDAVLAEPMLAALARHFPEHDLHLWAPAATCELFRAVPYIRRRQSIPRGFKAGNLEVFSLWRRRLELGYLLGRWKFAAAVYAAHSPEPLANWLLRSARAGQRWYSPGDTENQFAAQREATVARSSRVLELPLSAGSQHELTRNARLAAHWNARIESHRPAIQLDELAYAACEEQARSWRHVATWVHASAVVGLMPAASSVVKQYPAREWATAISHLWNKHRIACALLGGPSDILVIEELCEYLHHAPRLKMSHPLDLPAMAALISSLDGLVSVDTGLAHVAMAQGLPTVILTGGGHPGRFFPWPDAKNGVALNHPMPCQGCHNRCHLPEPHCLTEIDPRQIADAVARLVLRGSALPLRIAG